MISLNDIAVIGQRIAKASDDLQRQIVALRDRQTFREAADHDRDAAVDALRERVDVLEAADREREAALVALLDRLAVVEAALMALTREASR